MRAFHPLDLRGARQRLLFAVALGVVARFVVSDLSPVTHTLIAADVSGLALLVLAGWIVVTSDGDETRRRAAAQDPGRLVVWIIVLGMSTVSLFATTFILRHAKTLPHFESRLLLILSLATGAGAWLLTHTAFTLRYAHLYYRGGADDEGGIEFPGKDKPDDLDFAYFAFTIGMCFQVSDAQITDRLIRRTALLHALLSFAYNTGILALVLNVVMSQLG